MRTAIATFLISLSFASASSASCSTDKPEAWQEFFERYSNSLQFSLDRTIFPLPVLVWEYGLDSKGGDASEARKSTISRAQYLKDAFVLAPYAKARGLKFRAKPHSASEITIELFQEDTDYLVVYHFSRVLGCWFMRQVENQSL